jgi:hypothetical protein
MTLVVNNAKSLDEGVKNLRAGAKADYVSWTTNSKTGEVSEYSKEEIANWDSKTSIRPGKKYIKIVQDTGVFAFIVKEDFKHFKKGDILKAAGFNAPALNRARGNVLDGNYHVKWTGPLYMDSQSRLRG